MNIKVGDRVRIKTEEELLASDGSWHIIKNLFDELSYAKEDCSDGRRCRYTIEPNRLGKIYTVSELEQDGWICVNPRNTIIPIFAISEILPKQQTLDEYICSLPLEERAEKFILHFEGYGTLPYYSALTKDGYLHYDEALQATIEALKSPKEEE